MIDLALIGAGWIGRIHAEAMAGSRGCRLAAVCDRDPQARALAEKHGARFYYDYRELLTKEKVLGAVVAVPNQLHTSVGMACAAQGVSILMEKPLAPSLAEADALIAAAARGKVKLLVGHHRRFNAAVEKTRRIIKEGELGTLVAVNVLWALLKSDDYFLPAWRRSADAGPLLVNLLHDIDNIRFVCGEVSRVFAQASRRIRNNEGEDTAAAVLHLANGALVSILLSDSTPSPFAYELNAGENPIFPQHDENCYFFFGTKASLLFPSLKKYHYREAAPRGWKEKIVCETLSVKPVNPYERQIEHFCAVLRGDAAEMTSGPDARRTLAVIMALKESAATGRAVDLD